VSPVDYGRIIVTLNVLAVTSEAYPLAKTGGLGDAVSGLAHALGKSAAQVTLMLPAYPSAARLVPDLHEVASLAGLPGGDAILLAGECQELGVPVLLLKNDALYDRPGLYVGTDGSEYPDNAIRFAALSHAAARVAQGIHGVSRPHIVHLHDWHTALTPLLMRELQIEDVKTVLTLHNVAFQGLFPLSLAADLGIEPQYCNHQGIEYWGQLNFLKAGIRYADLVTVVSRNYAREILTPKFGCGLEGVLAARGGDIISIPNGIDTALWNPRADRYLRGCAYSAEHLGNKAACKSELQRAFGLNRDANAVLMAMGSRLTTQKMADVAAQAIPFALEAYPDLQACIIGQGEKRLETALRDMAGRYPGRCSVHIGFDEPLAHLLHAGADILLHGSRFEPFGLTPLYSMRYGTIPVASKVGGMADTIVDPGTDRPASAMREATGILFAGEQVGDMAHAIERTMALRGTPDIWRAMQFNGMHTDFSWARSIPDYLAAYHALRPDIALDGVKDRRRNGALARIPLSVAANDFSAAGLKAAAKKTRMRRPRKGGLIGTLAPHGATAA